MEQSGGGSSSSNTVESCLSGVSVINNNRQHIKNKSRPQSGGAPRPCQQHHRQGARHSLPQIIPHNGQSTGGLIILDDGRQPRSRIHTNSGCLPVVIMRHHRGRPTTTTTQGNHRVSTASQTSLEENDNNAVNVNTATCTKTESISVGDRVISSITCSVSHQASNISARNYDHGFAVDDDDRPSRVSRDAKTALMDRKASSSSGSVSGPTSTSVPSTNKSSSSSNNERLTGTSSSHTSRDSVSPIGRKQKRRHSRHAVERRRASSSTTTCSTSPTDCSSRSSTSSSFGRGRSARNKFISTSSSSDSEEDYRHLPPSRRMIARMANGSIRHEVLDANVGGAVQYEHRHRKNSGTLAGTPPRGRPKLAKASRERVGSGSRRTNSSGPATRHNTQGAANQAIVGIRNASTLTPAPEQVNLRQKRPNSLNLRLSRQSHPAVQPRQSHPLSVSFVEERDPWIHRDTGRTYTSVGVQSMPEQQHQKSKWSDGIQVKTLSLVTNNPSPPNQGAVSAPTPSTEPLSSVPTITPKPRPKSMVELSQDTSVIVSRFLKQSIAGLSPAIQTVLEDIQSVIATDEQYLAEAMQSHSIIDAYIEKTDFSEKLAREQSTPQDLPSTRPQLPKVTSTRPEPLKEKDTATDHLKEDAIKPEVKNGKPHLPESPGPSPLKSCKELLKQTLEANGGGMDGVLPSTETKFLCHSCPDVAFIEAEGNKNHETLLQTCLVKTLESARETVL